MQAKSHIDPRHTKWQNYSLAKSVLIRVQWATYVSHSSRKLCSPMWQDGIQSAVTRLTEAASNDQSSRQKRCCKVSAFVQHWSRCRPRFCTFRHARTHARTHTHTHTHARTHTRTRTHTHQQLSAQYQQSTRPESSQPYTEWSSRSGSESPSVKADVYVWWYTLLVVYARKREEEDRRCKNWSYIVIYLLIWHHGKGATVKIYKNWVTAKNSTVKRTAILGH